MSCEELKALAGAYALGVLDPEERAACEAHLAEVMEHRGCEEAIRRAFATVAALSGALPPVAPGEGVWRAIEARIGAGATLAAPRPRRALAWAGWAAAAAAALFLALWAVERRDAERGREAVQAAQRLAQAEAQARAGLEAELRSMRNAVDAQRQVTALLDTPGSRVVSLAAVPGRSGRAAAVVNLATRPAGIVSSSLRPQPGSTYQLWVIQGTAAPRPAGFLEPGYGGVLLGQVDPALLAVAPDALAVSLEPPGGSPAPTDVQLVGKLAG